MKKITQDQQQEYDSMVKVMAVGIFDLLRPKSHVSGEMSELLGEEFAKIWLALDGLELH